MTEEERILAQIKQLYPNISDEQLCLMIIRLVKGPLKKKISKAKERRFSVFLIWVMQIACSEGKSETAAIREAQEFASSNGKNEDYVKTLWRRFKQNPEKYKKLFDEHFSEIDPFFELWQSGENPKRLNFPKLWELLYNHDSL